MTTRRGSAPAAKLARNSGSASDGRTMLLTYLFLLMAAIQEISARIGRATGYGRRRECLPMAADFCDLKDGEIVAIWSCGPLGQFAIKSAFLLGLRMVCASAAAAVPVALFTLRQPLLHRPSCSYGVWRAGGLAIICILATIVLSNQLGREWPWMGGDREAEQVYIRHITTHYLWHRTCQAGRAALTGSAPSSLGKPDGRGPLRGEPDP